EYLTDEELLERARKNLPDWQRLFRIVNKARWIGTQTRPSPRYEEEEENPADEEVYLPIRDPATEHPASHQLAGSRRVTCSISWVLFVLVGLFSLGWMGPWPSLLEAHDGIYAGSTSLLSMAFWHVATWPFLWLAMLLYTLYQWAPSQ